MELETVSSLSKRSESIIEEFQFWDPSPQMLQDMVDSVLARRIFHALRAEQLAAKYGDKLADPATRALVKPELQWILGSFAISLGLVA